MKNVGKKINKWYDELIKPSIFEYFIWELSTSYQSLTKKLKKYNLQL